MRKFIIADLIVQTPLVFWLIYAAAHLLTGPRDIVMTGLAQLATGTWQIIAAFIIIVYTSARRRARIVHLTLSAVYLGGLTIWFNISPPGISPAVLFAPAWLLALFYYIITVLSLTTFNGVSGRGFLPHLSF